MKLESLKNVLKLEFDFLDNEVCGSFYCELEAIKPKWARKLDVISITEKYVTCNFVELLRTNTNAVRNYIETEYNECDAKSWLLSQLCEAENILDDGGDAIYYFMQEDLAEFLTK